MTEEPLIQDETAALAGQKGFDRFTEQRSIKLDGYGEYTPGVTQSFLETWIRDRGICIVIIPTVTSHYIYKLVSVWKKDFKMEDKPVEVPPYDNVNAHDYQTYEAAKEAALVESLNLLTI